MSFLQEVVIAVGQAQLSYLLKGMDRHDSLTQEEIERHKILTCRAWPLTTYIEQIMR